MTAYRRVPLGRGGKPLEKGKFTKQKVLSKKGEKGAGKGGYEGGGKEGGFEKNPSRSLFQRNKKVTPTPKKANWGPEGRG